MRALACLLTAALFLASCGKKGALIYPEMLVPAAPSAVSGQQTGPLIKLSFVAPQRDRAGRPLRDLAGIKVLRREAVTGQSDSCSACVADFVLFHKLYMDLPDQAVRRYGSLMMLLDTDVRIGSDYSYIVVAYNGDDREGEAAPAVTVGMVSPPVPPTLTATAEPTEIRLKFVPRPPSQGIVVGHNLYRVVKGEPMSYLPHNKELLTGDTFVDVGLERRVVYSYVARTVVKVSSGALVEGAASTEVNVQLLEE